MQAIAITNQTALTATNGILNSSLVDDFIAYIDRTKKTAQTYLTNLRQFAAWMCYKGITRPEHKDIVSYRDYLAAEHEAIQIDPATGWKYRTDRNGNPCIITCKPNTTALYLRSVCQFFKWLSVNGIYPNIADGVHAPKVRHDLHKKDALKAADVLTIENSIKEQAADKTAAAAANRKDTAGRIERATEQGKRDYAMYLLAVNAGLRTIELERANCGDIEVKAGQAYLYIWGKGHSEADQKKPLAPEVYAAIKDYLNNRADRPTKTSPLFVATGNRSGGKRIAARTISQMLKKAMIAAGYDSERITAHSLRHTAGTAVMKISDHNLYTTQHYMRHSNPATTEIYLHNDTEEQEISIAQDLYNYYHAQEAASI